MSGRTTQHDYAVRLDRVITWLADHLDDTIDLARMADVACMSPYHFHRIYHAMLGETVMNTVRRLRLHRAAVELITGTSPVESIARRAGYASQEAFTRAFKAAYQITPGRYRASFDAAPGIPAKEGTVDATLTTSTYRATIRETTPIRVVSLSHRGDYQEIGTTFDRLVALAKGQGLLQPDMRSFGIYYDDWRSTPKDQLRSDACLTLPRGMMPQGDLQVREIRGGRYGVTLHVGPYAELDRAYTWLFGTWLPQSGEEAADGPCIEEYLNDPHTLPPTEWKTEVWLPLL